MELMLYQELMEKIITSTFSTLILKKNHKQSYLVINYLIY